MPGVEEPFVIPRSDSDPYRGVVSPADAAERALTPVILAVGENLGDEQLEVQLTPITPDGFFFNRIRKDVTVVGQKLAVHVGLEASDDYISQPMRRMAQWLGSEVGLSLMPEDAPTITDRSPTELRVHRQVNPENFTYLYDDKDQPVDPRIVTRQIIPVRAYQWLPGPVRKSPSRGELDPTYSPRPVAVAIAQLIEITGINPHAHAKVA